MAQTIILALAHTDPFRVVSDLTDLSPHEADRVVALAIVRGSSVPLIDEIFPCLRPHARNPPTPEYVFTNRNTYILLPNYKYGRWKVNDLPRRGTGNSGALYLAEFDGPSSLGMVQEIPAEKKTSIHLHHRKKTIEHWVVTAPGGEFLVRREPSGSRARIPLAERGSIVTVRAGQLHQTVAGEASSVETFLMVRGATRVEHMKDHHHDVWVEDARSCVRIHSVT